MVDGAGLVHQNIIVEQKHRTITGTKQLRLINFRGVMRSEMSQRDKGLISERRIL